MNKITRTKLSELSYRLIWQREDEPQNLLSYLFIYQSMIYGLFFVLFETSSAVARSPFTDSLFPVEVWGILFLLLSAMALIGIVTRSPLIGNTVGFLGVGIWSYGLVLYVIAGSTFAALAVYVPQIMFWFFWHIGIKRFYEKERLADVRKQNS